MMDPVYIYETPQGGMVIAYYVETEVTAFFIVAFDDTSSEEEWGVGTSLQAALQNAAEEWGEEEDNPFLQALSSLA